MNEPLRLKETKTSENLKFLFPLAKKDEWTSPIKGDENPLLQYAISRAVSDEWTSPIKGDENLLPCRQSLAATSRRWMNLSD